MSFVAKKLYYKIREVCEIVGVEAHVLRFWESEFPALSPPKSKTGQRTYRPKDIERRYNEMQRMKDAVEKGQLPARDGR